MPLLPLMFSFAILRYLPDAMPFRRHFFTPPFLHIAISPAPRAPLTPISPRWFIADAFCRHIISPPIAPPLSYFLPYFSCRDIFRLLDAALHFRRYAAARLRSAAQPDANVPFRFR